MEKVIIKSATLNSWNDKGLLNITLEDGRIGLSYSLELAEYIGKEIELEIVQGAVFQGVQQYYFKLPKKPKENKWTNKAAPNDMTLEKRRIALECATQFHLGKARDISYTYITVLRIADNFYEWLNKQ
jgi:hypothetical protein